MNEVTSVSIDKVGTFNLINNEMWLCQSPVNERFRYIDVDSNQADCLNGQQIELLHKVEVGLEHFITLAKMYYAADNDDYQEKHGDMVYDGITILSSDDEDDFEVDLSFTDWDDGFVNIIFRDGEPVDYYHGD